MHLQRPYGDELVGSVLSRAMRELGLRPTTLLQELTGQPMMQHSLVVTRQAGIAHACGMSLEDFNRRHTVLRYSIGFMPPERRRRMWASMLVATPKPKPPAALAQSAINGAFPLRYCPACVHEDLVMHGESYWRRVHQLPGVTMCIEHRRHLVGSTIPLSAPAPVPLPHELCCDGECALHLAEDIELAIAHWSEEALAGHTLLDELWATWYRQRAIECGYVRLNGSAYGELLARDLQSFFGKEVLERLQCAIGSDFAQAWPARLLRPSSFHTEPLKHILLLVFFQYAANPSYDPERHERTPRGSQFDWKQVDAEAVEALERELETLSSSRQRSSVDSLMKRVGLESSWRYSRSKLPMVAEWVAAFKCSCYSERQVGGRPRGKLDS
ncbi:hypothetical protein FHT39_000330 [Mitsuaria sp. BK045]|uniref:TnsD family Tn7-like transposition protein n=1 Tax=unclassified Roseateles TaxID=2626991 RepID=UPI00160E9E5A|nr:MULTISPECIES: TnsD family Tn7-like transposition protein [unclassified Roseateles]MBB3360908.1 hypothetical protein [Mitsuaria sp. BK045]